MRRNFPKNFNSFFMETSIGTISVRCVACYKISESRLFSPCTPRGSCRSQFSIHLGRLRTRKLVRRPAIVGEIGIAGHREAPLNHQTEGIAELAVGEQRIAGDLEGTETFQAFKRGEIGEKGITGDRKPRGGEEPVEAPQACTARPAPGSDQFGRPAHATPLRPAP